jgi:hypothetical protein
MSEKSQCWQPAREALSPYGVLVRVENALGSGHPDALYCLLGVAGLVECKVDLGTLSLDQVLWAESWQSAGGLSWTLWRHPRGWALLDAAGMRRVYQSSFEPREVAKLWTDSKRFPTSLVLGHLAPVLLRRVMTCPS